MSGDPKERTLEKPNRDDTHEQREEDQPREGVIGDPKHPPPDIEKAPGKPTPGAPSVPHTKR